MATLRQIIDYRVLGTAMRITIRSDPLPLTVSDMPTVPTISRRLDIDIETVKASLRRLEESEAVRKCDIEILGAAVATYMPTYKGILRFRKEGAR